MLSLESLRSYRLGEYAIFDLASSFIGIIILSPILTRIFRLVHLEIPFLSWILFTLPLSILIHILTGNYTLMTRYFLDPSSHYPLKILIIVLTVLGVSKISIIR